MAREYNTRHETTHTSIGDSSLSDFDPEHEALVSTRQLDNSDKVSDQQGSVQGSARKNRTSPRQEPDYAINTSAIERAFPEFSDVESEEEEEEDDDISIEVGRGSKKPENRLDDSRNSMMSIENSVRSSSPAVRVDYPPSSHTPPKSALRSSSKRVNSSDNLRKDAQIRRASQAQKENVDPQPSKSKNSTVSGTRSTEQRRTLSEMHAKVRETYEGSYISDERPQNISVNARTTRFGYRDVSAQVAAAVDQASREALLKEGRRGKLAANSRNVPANGTYTTNTFPDTTTHHSFLLPDLPNLSELVSGVYEDGTPVFPRQSKSRTTRFVSPSGAAADLSQTQDHLPVDSVPIPEDEKALFVSLKLLQDKVADLEFAKSEAERKLDAVRQENALLKAEKSRRQKEQYDRLKTGDEEDQGRSSRRLLQEKNRLEAANLALQNSLDIAERKIQVHETTLKNLSRERDSAVSQLGVAYLNAQDYKKENEALRRENAELRAQLAKLTSLSQKLGGYEGDTRDSTNQKHWEADAMAADNNDDSQIHTQRSVESTRRGREQSRNQDRGSRAAPPEARISSQIEKEISKIEKERQDEELFSLNLSQPTRASTHLKSSQSAGHAKTESAESKKQPNTGKQRVKRVIVEETNTSEPLDVNLDNLTEDARNQASADQDVTFLSFIDAREIAQLRKTLEEERAARKQRQSLSKEVAANASVGPRRQSGQVSEHSRKPSLKETKEKVPRPSSAIGETTATGKIDLDGQDDQAASERRRRHSDNSIPTHSRRRRPTAEMTSAFILPDITLRYVDSEAHPTAKLSESAQKVLNSVARHDGKNCTVCKRLLPNGASHDHEHGDNRKTITIPKPVPVSQRMPEPSAYNEEPTMRPSQPPALALATVLKSLEDELAHLKMQLATYQSAYTKHDASLSKRQRKSLSKRIEKLLKEVDTKADQIYALYDVLEGQKQDGHEMTEHEVEVTLQSIGIDINAGRTADLTGATDESTRKKSEAPDDTEDVDDELPWEGFESTVEVTGRSVESGRND